MTYAEKLRDPRWQKRRLLIFQRAEFACENCGEAEETLEVHHLYYKRNTEPWDYPDDALLCLCHTCHKVRPESERRLAVALGRHDWAVLQSIARFLKWMDGIEIQERLTSKIYEHQSHD